MAEQQFIDLCINGKLDEAKQLLEANPTINISVFNEYAFRYACYNGHLEVAQWLLQVKPNINISAEDEYAFRWSCCYGHLEVAQWLLQVCPTINISAENEGAFRWSCCYGHLEVAQWLLQVCPTINISAKNEWAFRNTCKYGEVAQWLQSLKPYLYVIYYNENGSYKSYYIRNKEEERWEKRKLLVWLASDQSPNKECLLYKMPQDVSRYIISNYL